MKRKLSSHRKLIFITVAVTFAVAALLIGLKFFGLLPKKIYYASDFGIEEIKSEVDYNGNGVDDYTDIMLGARKDAENHPRYDGSYVAGGYPDDSIGVCTDVVWRAFKNAGYSLRDMVDEDIKKSPEDYPGVSSRDSNIDFRRVVNLKVFFDKYAVSLTVDKSDIAAFQAGDIVIFEVDKHIGIVSDKRDKNGMPYIIHNGGQPKREEDYLLRGKLTGHYRFDASRVESILIPFE